MKIASAPVGLVFLSLLLAGLGTAWVATVPPPEPRAQAPIAVAPLGPDAALSELLRTGRFRPAASLPDRLTAPDLSETDWVSLDDPDQVASGYNLVVSGHAPQAWIMDRTGVVRHRWDGKRVRGAFGRPNDGLWQRAALLANGTLVTVDGLRVQALNLDGSVAYAGPDKPQAVVLPHEAGVLVVTRGLGHSDALARKRVVDNRLTWVGADGGETKVRSLLQAHVNHGVDEVWRTRVNQGGDAFATQAVLPLAKGGFLFVLEGLSALVAVDAEAERVVWSVPFPAGVQIKDAAVRADGRLVTFEVDATATRIAVRSLPALEMSWSYEVGPASKGPGMVQALDNGNVLVTLCDEGRALEVAPNKAVVWTYHTPYRTTDQVATLFQVSRVPDDELTWLGAP